MKKFEITQEQLKAIEAYGCIYVKHWFPEAFEKPLEVGNWYKTNDGWLFNYQENCEVYGFTPDGWSPCSCTSWGWSSDSTDGVSEASDKEVETALIAEAKKRGFAKGIIFKSPIHKFESTVLNYYFSKPDNCLYSNGVAIFNDGKWATIIETITKEEAEKLLKKKIV